MDYVKYMEMIIRKNALKYSGLNVKAKEFIPQKYEKRVLQGSEDDLFDKLESDFVKYNVWLFE
jgi:hypothetical protein